MHQNCDFEILKRMKKKVLFSHHQNRKKYFMQHILKQSSFTKENKLQWLFEYINHSPLKPRQAYNLRILSIYTHIFITKFKL